jgi:Ribophorin I
MIASQIEFENAVFNEDHILLGPYKDISPRQRDSKAPFILHFVNNLPRLVIRELIRRIYVSHLFQQISITEHYKLYNDSPK